LFKRYLGERFLYNKKSLIDMKAVLIKPIGKSVAEILIDKLMFKSRSEALEAFDGMSSTEYFRKLRDTMSKQKTF